MDANDHQGAFVLSLHGPGKIGLDTFRARKSWFFFGDTIVCLGTGIRNEIADHETGTTLFQDHWLPPGNKSTPFYWQSGESMDDFPLVKQVSLAQPLWLISRQSLGFYLYPGQQLMLRRSEQRNPSSDGKQQTTGKFTTAWLSHGQTPRDASYRYILRLGATPAGMAAFADSMATDSPIAILQQDDDAHVVAAVAGGSEGSVIFKADAVVKSGVIAAASRPCVVWCQRSGDTLALSVADPDLNLAGSDKDPNQWGYSLPSTVVLTLRGTWRAPDGDNLTMSSPVEGHTTLSVRCQNGATTTATLRQ